MSKTRQLHKQEYMEYSGKGVAGEEWLVMDDKYWIADDEGQAESKYKYY